MGRKKEKERKERGTEDGQDGHERKTWREGKKKYDHKIAVVHLLALLFIRSTVGKL